MNETKPGERADTIHIEGLPIRWFQVGKSVRLYRTRNEDKTIRFSMVVVQPEIF